MRRRKTADTTARACVEQAARIIVKNAFGKGWKLYFEKYKAAGCTQAQSVELAATAAAFEGLKNLVASGITSNKVNSVRAVSLILRESRVRYLPKNERRLHEKFKSGMAGRSVLELVHLPRRGNQNGVRLKSMNNQSKQEKGKGSQNPRR